MVGKPVAVAQLFQPECGILFQPGSDFGCTFWEIALVNRSVEPVLTPAEEEKNLSAFFLSRPWQATPGRDIAQDIPIGSMNQPLHSMMR